MNHIEKQLRAGLEAGAWVSTTSAAQGPAGLAFARAQNAGSNAVHVIYSQDKGLQAQAPGAESGVPRGTKQLFTKVR